ncbi:family 43 glycosylhydrolase [Paenibacillus sp. PL91]|uniref:family 43 glycosylhydrolase n=1 Tax=Paenibacillus sp. PL91 TaxID=2729538 RepID=UPI00145D46BC|nr:family 43 glycosylhydrolase [Paenibacillus sp. PL91]MBC9202489.1 family 43 glycosylhydrolase [Paenibacillus sp. PL91]
MAHIGSSIDNFYNVVMQDGADPWVYKHTDGYYYFTKTTGSDVTIWKSRQLTTMEAAPKSVINTGGYNIWAPELHYIDGAWFIYYAKDDGDNVNHRMYVMRNDSADPTRGTWEYKGQITDSTDKWAIDGTVMQVNGHLYFIWSGWEGDINVRQNLYIAYMSNPWTIDSNRVEISRPTYNWEINHSPHVNEGPQVIIRNDVINLVYSASGSWTDDYCLGLITASTTSDLLNPASWSKRNYPVFQSGNGLYAPGHHSFTKSPDGSEDWIIYHVAKYSHAGWNREVRLQPFTWHADDTPNLGVPADPNEPIALPSGEAAGIRYGAEYSQFNIAENYVEFSVEAAAAGEYILLARTADGTDVGKSSYLLLSVNPGPPNRLCIANKGWENWGLSTARIQLKAGWNKIRFSKGEGHGEIDCLDIKPAVT